MSTENISNKITKNTSQLSTNQEQQLISNLSEMITRSTLSILAGTEFKGDRDYYEILGYNKEVTFDMYWAKYKRQGIASRVIKAPVEESWRQEPVITDDGESDKETKFEKSWDKLLKRLRVYHYMKRADKLSRIGRYGVLFIGVKGDKEASELKNEMPKLSGPDDVIYLRPYTEKNAEV
ncbi:MAG: anti-CBASS protein Acb1 family protein, partial [bacterium]